MQSNCCTHPRRYENIRPEWCGRPKFFGGVTLIITLAGVQTVTNKVMTLLENKKKIFRINEKPGGDLLNVDPRSSDVLVTDHIVNKAG